MSIVSIINREEVDARLEINDTMKENLMKATKWIQFMNIVSSISILCLAFSGGLILFFNGIMDSSHSVNTFKGVAHLASAAISFPVLKRSFTFVEQARSACKYDDNEKLAGMFDSLRFVAKYTGIVCVVILAIYAIAIIVAVFAVSLN